MLYLNMFESLHANMTEPVLFYESAKHYYIRRVSNGYTLEVQTIDDDDVLTETYISSTLSGAIAIIEEFESEA